jgi:hypothetical protein
MNSKNILIVLGAAVLCGIALAQTPTPATPTERLDALEREVAGLRAKSSKPQAPEGDELAAVKKELAETRLLAKQLASWVNAQAAAAAQLELVFDDSEQKGFTYGINPESRTVLLSGWRAFYTGMQADLPKVPSEPAAAKDAKSTPRAGH